MRCYRTVLAVSIFTTVLISTCLAQQAPTTTVPNFIRYDGTLKDAQGTPLCSATTGVMFAIYKQQDGGAPIWMETQNVTTDPSGNYNVLLGSGSATGLPSDLFSQQEQRWLGIQAQGQPEQPRVLLVSVPYAFHASEAERLAGHSITDFVTTDNLQTAVQQQLQQGSATDAAKSTNGTGGAQSVPTSGATDFIDTTTDQVVLVQQNGTGVGLSASSPNNVGVLGTVNSAAKNGISAGVEGTSTLNDGYGIFGYSSAASGGIGLQGRSDSPNGIGLQGFAIGTGGIAINATSSAASGNPIGMVARVSAPNATGALILNVANSTVTGPLISARTNAGTQFTVDGSGNVTSAGKYNGNGSALTGIQFSQLVGQLTSAQLNGTYSGAVTLSNASNALSGTFAGNGAGITGIQFSQLVGQLASSQLTGTYNGAVTLSNTSNVLYGDGSHLTGITAGPGSTYYIQNGTSQQPSSSFNITGNGIAAGTLSGGTVNSATNYQIGGSGVLSIGALADNNLFAGIGAGASNTPGRGQHNVFLGSGAGQGNTTGVLNTFIGFQTGYSNTTASNNTFVGYQVGYNNTSGTNNSFYGVNAGYSNTSGRDDTFSGQNAGNSNANGSYNAFYGTSAGVTNTSGSYNTLIGRYAGYSNTTASSNTFLGEETGYTNSTGTQNTFLGQGAGYSNTTGSYNLFTGLDAGFSNTTGHDNTFVGYKAGYDNTTGVGNVFYGESAGDNSHSSYNTFLGFFAGTNNTTGHNDVYIGNLGPAAGNESNAIRIGGDTNNGYGSQTAAYMAGIFQESVDAGTAVAVYVDTNGKLGTMLSSRRFKEQIRDMGDSTNALMRLRPVTFLYKPEFNRGDPTLQFGLIAEEVAQVYPELVAYGHDGQPYTVRYQYLASMLLNEVQKQHRRAEDQTKQLDAQQAMIVSQQSRMAAQQDQIVSQQRQIAAQAQQIADLNRQLQVQNVAMQERLMRLERVIGSQTQTVAAAEAKP